MENVPRWLLVTVSGYQVTETNIQRMKQGSTKELDDFHILAILVSHQPPSECSNAQHHAASFVCLTSSCCGDLTCPCLSVSVVGCSGTHGWKSLCKNFLKLIIVLTHIHKNPQVWPCALQTQQIWKFERIYETLQHACTRQMQLNTGCCELCYHMLHSFI